MRLIGKKNFIRLTALIYIYILCLTEERHSCIFIFGWTIPLNLLIWIVIIINKWSEMSAINKHVVLNENRMWVRKGERMFTLSASSIHVCLQSSSSMPIPITALITAWHVATLPALSHSSASWDRHQLWMNTSGYKIGSLIYLSMQLNWET